MQNVSTRAPWFAAVLTSLFLASPVLAADNKDELERVSRSIEVLEQLMAAPDDAIPEHILERAEAIVVIPTLVKGGFVLGAEHGKGVMSIRNRTKGTWSVPSFVFPEGPCFAQSTYGTLVLLTKRRVIWIPQPERRGANSQDRGSTGSMNLKRWKSVSRV